MKIELTGMLRGVEIAGENEVRALVRRKDGAVIIPMPASEKDRLEALIDRQVNVVSNEFRFQPLRSGFPAIFCTGKSTIF
jgi:hypothetical protein